VLNGARLILEEARVRAQRSFERALIRIGEVRRGQFPIGRVTLAVEAHQMERLRLQQSD
jgi:hypothetical protein